ncbi:thiolase family protein [Patulibacter sp.]|uniref:thiolase family protein n=1 Tax=Patulibacter sp. TaxID=1912859 RepID=UPI002726684A|nr:thiolase family protein [Patulibacter sp.]MDO9407715.1 thiolase family protein [Patulibacter sp.]
MSGRGRLSDVAIVGVGATTQARRLGTTSLHASLEAAKAALADAGLTKDDVDGIAARWPGPGGTVFQPGSADWAGLLGIHVDWIGDSYPQGVPAVLDAAAAIGAGLCETVLITGGQAGVMEAEAGKVAKYTRPANEFVEPYGSFTSTQFALVAQRYLHRFPEARGAMAEVAAAIRNTGSANPEAVMHGRGPYTAQDVLDAPKVVDPFTRLDLCLANEGAAALVLTTVERARACRKAPVVVLGGGMEWMRQQYVDPPRYEEVRTVGAKAARRAFSMCGLGPEDVDAFQLYDVNSYEVLRQFEAIGLCGEGEAGDLVRERGIGVDGGLPTCTDGGVLSFSHIGWGAPTLKIIEGVRQVRGEAGDRQVAGAQVALAAGAGAGAQYHNVVLLGPDR